MNATKIEWCKNPDGSQGWSWSPVTGCLNGCPYCYARRLANGRLKPKYLKNWQFAPIFRYIDDMKVRVGADPRPNDPFYPRFWPERVKDMDMFGKKKTYAVNIRKSKGIFVCDMSDLFGDWVPEHWQKSIFLAIKSNPQYRFYLLTKQPQNLAKFSPFPKNCFVGVTATNRIEFNMAARALAEIQAEFKYISFEPLLRRIQHTAIPYLEALFKEGWLQWLIIGACTGTKNQLLSLMHTSLKSQVENLKLMQWKGNLWTLQPEISWVKEIVEAAGKAGIKVFLKDNLKPLLRNDQGWTSALFVNARDSSGNEWLRQEMP